MKDDRTDWRWLAVRARNPEFDGVFYFGVRTTGVFCRPSCSSRSPRRENVAFFSTAAEAERRGFRACLRCKPAMGYSPRPAAELVTRALDLVRRESDEVPTVDELAKRIGVTRGHLQKTFKALLGVSPKEVMDNMRIESFKEHVKETDITTSLYESGFGSSRGLYEKAGERLGMTPATYKKGGKGIGISYTIVASPVGRMLVAATTRGICSVSFGESDKELEGELREEFFAADIERDDARLGDAVAAIIKGLNGERAILNLPLDIRGTAFQMRVWSELRKIPYGETRSYKEVAENIGDTNAVRAVARACATNPVAIVTPCHRVVASDGKLAGYKWGIERKSAILGSEKAERLK